MSAHPAAPPTDARPQAPIAVAMSGGVDSSTVAALLHERGCDIVGLTMQLWDPRRLPATPEAAAPRRGRCCSSQDTGDARRVAEQLGIPYYVVNFEERFERDVVRNFVAEYLRGRTPVPCSVCNTAVKFDQLVSTARQIGAAKVATGHYARVGFDAATGRYQLRRGADLGKDQSYFLWGLNQDQLRYAEFPLGELQKRDVRALAVRFGLVVADKPESYEICFVPGNDYAGFVSAYAAEQGMPTAASAGAVVNSAGEALGTHAGIHHFTVGQRKGLGLATRGLAATAEPFYVLGIDAAESRVVVGRDRELWRRELRATGCNWIAGAPPADAIRVEARIRNRHEPAAAWARALPGEGLEVVFDEPQRAITAGQAVVLYQHDQVLGGAWIESAHSVPADL